MRFTLFLIFFFANSYTLAHNNNSLIYIENKGQWEKNILFKSDIKGGALFLEKDKITVHIHTFQPHYKVDLNKTQDYKGQVYQIQFIGANLNPKIESKEETEEYFNYFLGSDSTKWKGHCRGFEEIIYKDIYPHIDLKINSANFSPKYTFIVHPGGNIGLIQMKYVGLNSMKIDEKGDLISSTILGDIVDEKPITFLHSGEGKIETIPSQYKLQDQSISFNIKGIELKENEYLEIDPQIIFSTYTGSLADNFGATATYDSYGNTYGSGLVFGTGYTTTTGSYDITFNGNSDIAITKFNANGTARIYSTYLGGDSYDVPHSLVVNSNDRLIVLGTTSSTNYPTTPGVIQPTFVGGTPIPFGSVTSLGGLGLAYPNGADIVITSFNNAGSGILASTYYGGIGIDGVGTSTSLVTNYGDNVRGFLETDTFGNIFIATLTNSAILPSSPNTVSFQNNLSGGFDGLILKLNGNLSNVLGKTYVGGSGDDALYNLKLTNNGNVVAVGGTVSSNLLTTAGVVNPTYGGTTDGMVVSLSNNLGSQNFLSYYGTPDYDQTYFVDVDKQNNIYLFGQTSHSATNYYIFNTTFSTTNKGQFISELNPTFSTKIKSTSIGTGNAFPDISPTAFLVDYCNKIYLVGWGSDLGNFNTFSLSTTGLPITPNAYQSSTNGNGFYLLIMENNLNSSFYGTFFGGVGTGAEEHVDGGTSRFDKNGIVYHAVCAGCGGQSNLPIYPSAASVVSGTNGSINCNLAVFKFDFGLPAKANFTAISVCAPGNVQFVNLSHKVGTNVTYKWIFQDGTTSTLAEPIKNYTNGGIYSATLIIIDSLSCNITDTITKNFMVIGGSLIDTLPEKFVCPNSSVRMGFEGVTDPSITVNWTPSSSLDDNTSLTPFASPSVTTIYRGIVTKNGCSDTFYQKINVVLLNSLAITGDSNSCGSGIKYYTATKFNGGTYDWFPKSTLVSSNKDSATFNFTTLPTQIQVNYTSPTGCQASAFFNINYRNIDISLSYDSIICKGDVVTIVKSISDTSGTYSYFPSSSVLYNSKDTVKIIADSSMSFIVDYSINSSCFDKDTIQLHWLNEFIHLTGDSLLCPNQLNNAQVDSASFYTIAWSPVSNLLTTQGARNAIFNLNNFNQYVYVTAQHKNKSHCNIKDSIEVRFINNILNIEGDTAICKGQNVRVTARKYPGTYTWSSDKGLLINTQDTFAIFKMDTSGRIFLNYSLNSNCVVKDTIYIKVRGDSLKIKYNPLSCIEDTVFLSTNYKDSAQFVWLPFGNIIGSNTMKIAKAKVDSSQWIYVEIQDTFGCYLLDSTKLIFSNEFNKTHADFVYITNCFTDSLTFINKSKSFGTNLTYKWDFNNEGISTLTNPKFKFSSGGFKIVKLIATDLTTCNKRDTLIDTVYVLYNHKNSLPTLLVCKYDSVNIGLENMLDSLTTIHWKPITHLNNPNIVNPKAWINNVLFYTGYISKNGCVDTLTRTILTDTNSIVKLKGDTFTCQFSSIDYTATKYPQGSYQWFPSSNIVYQNRDSATMLIKSDNQKIIVAYTSSYGCVSKDSIKIKIVPTTLDLTTDSILCMNEVIHIKYNTSPEGGSILFNPLTHITNFNKDSATYQMKGDEILKIKFLINNACFDEDTVSFKLLENKFEWNLDTIVCKGDNIQATALILKDYNVVWAPSNLLQTPQNSSPALLGPINNSPQMITVSANTTRPACNFTDTGYVYYLEKKGKLSGPSYVCKDSIIMLTANPPNQYKYTWGPINNLLNKHDNVALFYADTTRKYYLTISDASGCSFVDSLIVQISSDLYTIDGDSIVCPEEFATIFVNNIPGSTYKWNTGETSTSINKQINKTSLFQVSITDPYSCKLQKAFTVYSLDTNTFNILNYDKIVCAFDSVYITVTDLPVVTYTWSPASKIVSGLNTNSITAWINNDTKFYITVGIPGKSCDIKDSVFIEKDTQYIKLSGPSLTCRNDTAKVTANYNSNFTYYWSVPNQISNNLNTANYLVPDSFYVSCSASSTIAGKCKYIDSIKLNYSRYLYDLNIWASPPKVEYNFNTQLHSRVNNSIDYNWSPKELLENNLIPNPITLPLKDTTTFYVTVTDPVGCKSSDSITIPVIYEVCEEPEVYVPNAFTPNGDGKNDVLFVRGNNIVEMRIEIYDRWGELIFESNNQKKGWDGTYKGAHLEPGVFAYQVTVLCVGGHSYYKKGNITLIK